MPRANQDRYNPLGRVPRTIFAHAHTSGTNDFPPELLLETLSEAFTLTPDNWNGLDKLYLWLLGAATEQIQITVTIHIGTCDEAYNTHTQTVAAIAVNMTNTEYECVDLTTTFETVLANLATRDLIRVQVTRTSGTTSHNYMGIELQET